MSRATGHQWALVHSDGKRVWKVKNLTQHFEQHDYMVLVLEAVHVLIQEALVSAPRHTELLRVDALIRAAWPLGSPDGSCGNAPVGGAG